MEIKGVVGASQPRWIPVTERLPEKNGSFLVCTDNRAVFVTHFWIIDRRWSHHPTHITHWMPLPEPPKEVDHA